MVSSLETSCCRWNPTPPNESISFITRSEDSPTYIQSPARVLHRKGSARGGTTRRLTNRCNGNLTRAFVWLRQASVPRPVPLISNVRRHLQRSFLAKGEQPIEIATHSDLHRLEIPLNLLERSGALVCTWEAFFSSQLIVSKCCMLGWYLAKFEGLWIGVVEIRDSCCCQE